MKLYRIFTEDIQRNQIERICNEYVKSYTIVQAQGYWQSKVEPSLIIEICEIDRFTVQSIARSIRDFNKQEAVLVQTLDCEASFI